MRSSALPMAAIVLAVFGVGCRACRDDARDTKNEEPEKSACGDVSSNPRQCGACDHDCLGAVCEEGSCAPQLLAEGLDFPDDLAVDARFAYVLASNRIHRVPIEGGALQEVGADLGRKDGLAVDGESLYTFAKLDGVGRLMAIPAQDPAGKPRVVTELDRAYRIALDDSTVYVTTGPGDDARVLAIPKAGGETRVLIDHLDFATDVAIDGDDVVFVEYGKKRIGRISKKGGAPRFIATSATTIHAMTAGMGDVLWMNEGVQVLRSEAAPKTLGNTSGYDLALRDGFVYWANGTADGFVYRMRIEGGPLLKVAPSPQRVETVATDARYVYWAERGSMTAGGKLQSASGRLLRAAR